MKLLEEARRLMPRLPFEDGDLLIVDEMGKNLSGSGLDTNVIGRDTQGSFEAYLQEARARSGLRLETDPAPLVLDNQGNLVPVF